MKKVMPKPISMEQNIYSPGREITNNIILIFQTIHSIATETEKSMIIKLNISKEYDKVCWEFSFEMLKKLGYD